MNSAIHFGALYYYTSTKCMYYMCTSTNHVLRHFFHRQSQALIIILSYYVMRSKVSFLLHVHKLTGIFLFINRP